MITKSLYCCFLVRSCPQLVFKQLGWFPLPLLWLTSDFCLCRSTPRRSPRGRATSSWPCRPTNRRLLRAPPPEWPTSKTEICHPPSAGICNHIQRRTLISACLYVKHDSVLSCHHKGPDQLSNALHVWKTEIWRRHCREFSLAISSICLFMCFIENSSQLLPVKLTDVHNEIKGLCTQVCWFLTKVTPSLGNTVNFIEIELFHSLFWSKRTICVLKKILLKQNKAPFSASVPAT